MKDLNVQLYSKSDIKKLIAIFEKFGGCVTYLTISYEAVTEEDLYNILCFFPNIERLSITRNYSNEATTSKIVFGRKSESLTLTSLNSIDFSSKNLQFNKVFDNIQLTNKFKKLHVSITEPSSCFTFLKKYSSIEELTVMSKRAISSIPISHMTLKKVFLDIPKSKRLLPIVEQQTELLGFDFQSDNDTELDSSFESSDFSDSSGSSDESDAFPDENLIGDADILRAAIKMKNLTQLNLCIDGIPNDDFIHFSKLSQLGQLSITSKRLDKIKMFSTISLPDVTRLLLTFKRVRVRASEFISIAKNFPKVNDLHYNGEYFCDAFLCFAGNLNSLEKISIMRTHDYESDYEQYVPSNGVVSKVNTSLKSVSIYFSFPEERNVHAFMIRIALAAPNVENLSVSIDSMKIVHNNFIYILRNFKNLQNIKLSYDLYPDESERSASIRSMSDVERYAANNERKIIKTLKEYGSNLQFVELSLSSPNDYQHELWKISFCQQFASIKIDDLDIVMKKDVKFDKWKLF